MEKLIVLHVNALSLKRNLENLKARLEECELGFNIICVSETWFPNTNLQNNSNLSLTGFDSVPDKRLSLKRGFGGCGHGLGGCDGLDGFDGFGGFGGFDGFGGFNGFSGFDGFGRFGRFRSRFP